MKRLIGEWAIDEDTIVVENKAVGDICGRVAFERSGSLFCNRASDFSDDFCEMVTLDSYFEGEDISFIKMDIEGAEYKALVGAEQLIRRSKPKLAVSVYHNPDDIFRISDLIDSWMLGYKYKLRHHSSNCMETILYCYTENERGIV